MPTARLSGSLLTS